jgi:Asp-tRNA(Asn)/Glu-tRNA(Gln) amidotransferase A subunit family amidase
MDDRRRDWVEGGELETAMVATNLNELSAAKVAIGIAAGEITAEEVMHACLARIETSENSLSAWANVDPDLAIVAAKASDKMPTKGLLHGVPIGVKDVIDTFDLPTEMGSPIYRGHRPLSDAACIAQLRAAGAIILGKTVTCEFAGMTPGATRNPLDPARTPGGSSSGSAAAVADHMVPIALGTQTRGSILRPASYCGIVGYKPSYGLVARQGLKFAAESFDTIGVLVRTIEDAQLSASVLFGSASTKLPERSSAPSIGICLDGIERAEDESKNAIDDALASLAAAGAKLQPFVFPHDVEEFTAATKIINDVERARAMAWEWRTKPELISDRMRATIEEGLRTSPETYIAALRLMKDCRARLEAGFDGIDVLLAPCVNGEAPTGLDYTGDPFFQGLWTALHVPTISIPSHVGPSGLPVSIQLVGKNYEDESLLADARWVFGCVRSY